MKNKSAAIRLFLAGALAWAAPALQAAPFATYYVAATGSDTNSGTAATSPFLTIQKGVDAAAVGDTVLVGPGTYATGRTMPADSCYSRVVIEKDILVRSTHGAAQTIIQGQPNSGTSPFGPDSTRCVYMTAGTLDGFSLINGFADASSPPSEMDHPRLNGGGVYAPVNCRSNFVNNCIITGCGAYRGGGAYWSTLNNCTVVSNYVNTTSGVGVWGSWVRNSIVFFNEKENYSSPANSVDQTLFTYSCTTPAPGFNFTNQVNRDGGNNVTNSPLFVTGTFQLNTNSPCINAGTNGYASGALDAAGNARILGGTVDIGAFELLNPATTLGPIPDGTNAFFSTVYTNAGTLIFSWRVSSEPGFDKLALVIDGVETQAISGEFFGTVTQFVGGATAHTIQWVYSKDGSESSGQDRGWVSPQTWIPDELSKELGVPGHPVGFPYGQPGAALPFPYGFAACFVDTNAPAGAIGGAAVKLGGLSNGTNGVPLIGDSQTNAVESTLFGAGTLSFQWRTSSKQYDYLICTVDGAEVARISGNKTNVWSTFTTNLLTVASHTVRWSYAKDASGFSALDCGWVDSVTWNQFKYLLTVENGSGGGTNIVGDTVAISANPAPAGKEFAVWDGDTATLANVTSAATTLVMPGRAITVRALYRQKVLSVTVANGRDAGAWPNAVHDSTGEPESVYPEGALVRIVADPAPLWQTFDTWTSTPAVIFSNEYADVSMFVMGTNHVSVTAVYRPQTDAEKLAGALTIRGQPLAITSFSSNGVIAQATGGLRYDDPVVKLGGPSVGSGESVSLTTTNFTGNGYLLYSWRGDTEADVDGIQLLVNGTARSRIRSEKDTNTVDNIIWNLYLFRLTNVTNVTWRFTRDDTYYVRNNMVLVDRVTWIPEGLVSAIAAGACIPNINAEYDPLFEGRIHARADYAGEDGGVAWVHDAPGGGDAVRFGRFGYVTNSLYAQVAVTNYGTGILTWEWTARSEGSVDNLGFYIDGTKTNSISGKGNGTWTNASYVVKNLIDATREMNLGTERFFTFRYQKDIDVSMLEDCAWLRQAVWAPTYALQLTKGTNTAYVLPSQYATISDAVSQAKEGIFPAGTQVTLLAEPAPDGLYFDRWASDNGAALGSWVTDVHPTFLMPSNDLSLTATYTTNAPVIPHYSLTVVSGSGSGNYTNGTTVAIQANAPSLWHTFAGWTGSTATVANAAAPVTTVVTGTNSLVVTATYAAATPEVIIPTLIGVPSPVTTGNITVDNLSQTPPSVRLGPVGNSQSAFFQTVYTNAGTVIFPWSVDSEEGYDFLSFSVDGTNVTSISGKRSGVVTNFVSGGGQHVLRWSYTNDVSDTAGAAAGAVGTVTWISDALSSEFGVPGKPLFFPQGTASILLDYAPPAGAVSNIAAKLGGPIPVQDSAETAVEAIFSGAGTLSFNWRVSSELNHDFLAVSVDGAETAAISGNKTNAWLSLTTNLLTVANHTVRWTYRKDSANTNGLDCGWVDNVTWEQFKYLLTVENGLRSGTNNVGDTVPLTANAAPAGQQFDVWDGDTETIADVTSPTTTLVMPGRAITVRAMYKTQTLSVTVINGRDAGALPNPIHESTGEPEGAYPAGAFVRIVAATAPLWQAFDHWVSTNGAVFADAQAPITRFTMPANAVRVEAVYRVMTEAEKLAGALTIAGQDLAVTTFSVTGVVAVSTGGVRYNDPVVRFGGASVGPDQNVSLTTTNFTGSGVLLYWWRATAESRYDKIELVANNTTVVGSNSGKGTAWQLSTNWVTGATSLTFRFTRDGTYFVRDNTILIDRVTWIPQALITLLGGAPSSVPNINGEGSGFSGVDGGVAWVADAPTNSTAVRFGRFGYVNNNQHAQLSVTNTGTGIFKWDWATSSEADCDYLDFYSDGTLVRWISGKETNWVATATTVTNRPSLTRVQNRGLSHELLFKYSKDSDVSVFDDCAWLQGGTWTPTFQLTLTSAATTNFTLWPLLDATTAAAAQQEAGNNVFPGNTVVTIRADLPAPTYYFDRWAGNISILPAGGVTNPITTFTMPNYDVALTAMYSTNSTGPASWASPALFAPSAAKITGLGVQWVAQSALSIPSAPGSQTLALDLEGSAQTDYELLWSPDLASPFSQWQPLAIQYSEVLGDSPNGSVLIRLYLDVPASSARGFFRVRTR